MNRQQQVMTNKKLSLAHWILVLVLAVAGSHLDRAVNVLADESSSGSLDLDEELEGVWWNHNDDHGDYGHYYNKPANSTGQEVEREWQLMFRSFDQQFEDASKIFRSKSGKVDILRQLERTVPKSCGQSLAFIRYSMLKHKLWALKIADSNGKIGSGVTYGKLSSPGDYEECVNIRVDEEWTSAMSKGWGQLRQNWRGQYCLLDFRLPMPEKPKDVVMNLYESPLNLSGTQAAKEFPQLVNYTSYASIFYDIGYLIGVCLPSTCQITDVTNALTTIFEGMHIIVNNTIDCEMQEDSITMRPAQWISIIFFLLVALNATVATILYYNYQRHKEGHGTQTFIKQLAIKHSFYADSFSLQSNFAKLTKPDPRSLTFVHYTRIATMAITVITHTAGMGTLQAVTKPADAVNTANMFRDLITQMLANAFTSIQVFFFMAGYMLVLSTYGTVQRLKGKLPFLEFAIKRATRLMPGLVGILCLNFIWPLFVEGPLVKFSDRLIVKPCESNWWHTIFFMSNYDHVDKMCLRHSYFAASDYQLHLMAFPILVLLYRKPSIALIIAGLLVVSGFVAQCIMVTTKTAVPFMLIDYIDKEALYNVIHYLHHPVWNHISGFFSGFLTGYLIVKKIRWNLSPNTANRLYYVAAPGLFIAIFAPYYWNHYKQKIHKWQMAPYLVLDRGLLLSTLAYLTYHSSGLTSRRKSPPQSSKNNNKSAIKSDQVCGSQQQQSQLGASATSTETNSMKQNLPSAISVGDLISSETNKQQVTMVEDNLNSFASAPNLTDQNNSGGNQSYQPPSNLPADISPTLGNCDQKQKQQQIASDNNQQQPEQKARTRQAPKSTLNTLCLVLSRLTFQLYLANMAVLWIDVNQSKYLWHFSYYFIFVKSMCVYIMSVIVATVFYITLESPSVTIYATWAKLRAQNRLQKEKLREEVAKDTNEANNRMYQQLQQQQQQHVTNINAVGSHQDQFMATTQRSTGELDQQNLGGQQQFRYGQYTSVKPAPIHRIDTSSNLEALSK